VGHFFPNPGETWSQNAGALAFESRAAYRAVGGTISLMPIGSVAHALNESDGSLQLTGLTASRARMLANDVTVCGAIEPTAYVTELFQGDGATVLFDLTRKPYFPTASKAKAVIDSFQGPGINPVVWAVNDPGSMVSITSNGLTVGGGNGIDGETTVATIDQIELGGSIIAEIDGVLIGTGSAGMLCGLYNGGGDTLAECFAGFQLTQVAGSTTIFPVLAGVAVGSGFTPTAGRLYTLRIRAHCNEVQRVLQSYRSISGGAPVTFGGQQVPCLAYVVMEIQDVTSGANATVTVLYDGSAQNSPAAVTFMPFNSLTLMASIQSVSITRTGSAWVVAQPLGGPVATQRLGLVTTGAQCKVQENGKLRFYAADVPAAGELITVTYRTTGRAVARLANAASITAETLPTVPGTSRWSGSVTSPAAQSSADCENAAMALLSFTADRNSAWQGQYTAFNLQNGTDVWPGDVLAVASASAGLAANLVVRSVKVEIGSGFPETAKYIIQFANDWADDLSMKLSTSVPADAWIPARAEAGVAVLGNLSSLTVGTVSGTSIAVNAGVTPPVGGGFEVRRTDWVFRPGSDPDLVLRSPVQNFSIPREDLNELYFIRMYDGSPPPLYSRFSSAVFVNVPM
jgi:hypothetical protein